MAAARRLVPPRSTPIEYSIVSAMKPNDIKPRGMGGIGAQFRD
jgi:hypothetical protein